MVQATSNRSSQKRSSLRLSGQDPWRRTSPWPLPETEWERDPLASGRFERVSLLRALLAGGPDRPLPEDFGASLVQVLAVALADDPSQRPADEEAFDATLDGALREMGVCGRCGGELTDEHCGRCNLPRAIPGPS